MVEPQDLDILKDIPGYKAIFRALIKSQIQHLVEQLSCHTDEECVLLTASLSDGTLTHLGSNFGKQFLDSHDDVKKQFLGFCLKRQMRTSSSPDKAWSLGEASLSDTTPNKSPAKPGSRAKRNRAAASPYADFRQNKHFTTQGKTKADNNSIRHHQETTDIESAASAESHTQVLTEGIKVELGTNSDGISYTDTEQTEFHPDQFGGFNLEPENQTGSSSSDNNVSEGILNDSKVAVKLEPVNEDDEDLVLTHVEMNAAAGTDWGNQSFIGEQLSESSSLTEKQSPNSGPGLDLSEFKRTKEGCFICPHCPKKVYGSTDFMRHLRTHTGEKPFACEICHQRFSQSSSCYRHKRIVHKQIMYVYNYTK